MLLIVHIWHFHLCFISNSKSRKFNYKFNSVENNIGKSYSQQITWGIPEIATSFSISPSLKPIARLVSVEIWRKTLENPPKIVGVVRRWQHVRNLRQNRRSGSRRGGIGPTRMSNDCARWSRLTGGLAFVSGLTSWISTKKPFARSHTRIWTCDRFRQS